MSGRVKAARAAVCGVVCMLAASLALASDNAEGGDALSREVQQTLHWILASSDNRGLPFAIVDKKAARLLVFGPKGQPLGAAPALTGSASGDHDAPGLGRLEPALIPQLQRTTPAGRFASEPGRNLMGEAVVWVDYDAGLAIHRVRPGPAQAEREQRLASATPDDNRASLGCVVVTPTFFDGIVAPVLGQGRGVVYVLPETATLAASNEPLAVRAGL